MRLNRYLIMLKLNEEDYLIINPLYGTAVRADEELVEVLRGGSLESVPEEVMGSLVSLGFVVESEELDSRLRELVETDELPAPENLRFNSFEFVLTWSCNFACSYCFENKTKRELIGKMGIPHIESAFRFVDAYGDKSRGLSFMITGGEPLLVSNFPEVATLFKEAKKRGAKVAITTNGFNLEYYINLFRKYAETIDSIRVTLDGPERIHNSRRPLWGGHPTFSQIVRGIDEMISAGLGDKIVLITKWDESIVEYLPEYVEFLRDKGWLNELQVTFGVVGNYGNSPSTKTEEFARTRTVVRKIIEYLRDNPELVNSIGFSDEVGAVRLARSVLLEGKLPKPKARSCDGIRVKDRAVFSPDGSVYSCGMFAEAKILPIGQYHPSQALYADNILKLRSRNVLTLGECQECPLLPVCAGGCPFRHLSVEEFYELKSGIRDITQCTTCIDRVLLENELSRFFYDLRTGAITPSNGGRG